MLGVAGSTKGHLGYTSIYVLARQRVNATHGINNPAPSVRRLVRGVGLATGKLIIDLTTQATVNHKVLDDGTASIADLADLAKRSAPAPDGTNT